MCKGLIWTLLLRFIVLNQTRYVIYGCHLFCFNFLNILLNKNV